MLWQDQCILIWAPKPCGVYLRKPARMSSYCGARSSTDGSHKPFNIKCIDIKCAKIKFEDIGYDSTIVFILDKCPHDSTILSDPSFIQLLCAKMPPVAPNGIIWCVLHIEEVIKYTNSNPITIDYDEVEKKYLRKTSSCIFPLFSCILLSFILCLDHFIINPFIGRIFWKKR